MKVLSFTHLRVIPWPMSFCETQKKVFTKKKKKNPYIKSQCEPHFNFVDKTILNI